jgi:6-phosphogluconolactonase
MISIKDDLKNISLLAANEIIEAARNISKTKEHVLLALPGGRSVKGIYEELAESEDPIWRKIHIFLVDERVVPIDDSESNFKLIQDSFAKTLIEKNILPKENLHPLIIDKKEKDFGAKKYTSILNKYGGQFDIVLVSSGEDGHIAALYPDHKALKVSGKEYLFLDDSPKPPIKRITASVELISKAKFLIVVFIGESKLEAYDRFNNARIPIIDCPVKIAYKIDHSIVYTDLDQ